MKKIAFLMSFCFMVLLLPVVAFGNPFLVSDPQSVVDSYGVILDGQPEVLVPAQVLGLGVGRLCYSAILFSISIIWGILAGATALQLMPSILLWARSFRMKEKED